MHTINHSLIARQTSQRLADRKRKGFSLLPLCCWWCNAWLFGGAKAGSNPLLHPRLLFASDPLRIEMKTIRRIVLGINKYGAVVVPCCHCSIMHRRTCFCAGGAVNLFKAAATKRFQGRDEQDRRLPQLAWIHWSLPPHRPAGIRWTTGPHGPAAIGASGGSPLVDAGAVRRGAGAL